MATPKQPPRAPRADSPRVGGLWRDVDASQVSGTGLVAWVVEFPDGVAVMRWAARGAAPSTVVYDSISDLIRIHGHGGKTRVAWLPRVRGGRLLADTRRARLAYELHEHRLAAAAGTVGRLDWVESTAAAAAHVPQLVAAYEGLAAELAQAVAHQEGLAAKLVAAQEELLQVATRATAREAELRRELDAAYSALEATATATAAGGG